MGWKESKQAFQYALPYEQVFQAAMAAVPMVPKAVLTSADVNARFITFDTPTSFTSYGENIVVGFIPSETGVIVEVTCATKGLPNLMQDGRNRKKIKQYIDGLSGILQVSATEVIPPDARDATRRRSASTPVVPGLDYEAGEPSSAH